MLHSVTEVVIVPTAIKFKRGLTQSLDDLEAKNAVTVPDGHFTHEDCPVSSLYVPWSHC